MSSSRLSSVCSRSSRVSTICSDIGSSNKIIEEKQQPEKRKKGLSAHLTLINFLKGMIGPGCFSLPLAFKNAGLWTAFALVFIIGILCTISMAKILQCARYLMKKKNTTKPLDYGHMASAAFKYSFPSLAKLSKAALVFVNACLIALQLGVCSVFYVFVVDHLKEVVEYFNPDLQLAIKTYMLIIFVPFLLMTWVRSVLIMSYISLVGNILMIISVAIIFGQLMIADHDMDLPWITSFNGIVLAAGSIIYSFEGQAMILPLENKMEHPLEMQGWTGVLNTGLSLVTIVYVASGFYGYITYGADTQGTITLNLPDNKLNLAVKILLLLVIYTGFLVQLYPMVDALWPPMERRMKDKSRIAKFFAHYALRTVLYLMAVLFAALVPNLENIIPLVGVTAGMMLALIIPTTLHTVTFLPDLLKAKKTKQIVFLLLENVSICFLGIFFLIAGVNSNLRNIFGSSS